MVMDRTEIEELIDQPDTPAADIYDTLRDQAWVNRWLGGAHATLAHVVPILRRHNRERVSVLDLACGGADVTREIVDTARSFKLHTEVVALDLNPKALHFAREISTDYPEITYLQGDVLNPPDLGYPFDIVVQSTFLHHLKPEDTVRSLQVAAGLSRGKVVVADLMRSPLAYLGFKIIARLARFNPVSAHDGSASVLKSYTPGELAELAKEARLRNCKIYFHRFFRIALVCDGEAGDE